MATASCIPAAGLGTQKAGVASGEASIAGWMLAEKLGLGAFVLTSPCRCRFFPSLDEGPL